MKKDVDNDQLLRLLEYLAIQGLQWSRYNHNSLDEKHNKEIDRVVNRCGKTICQAFRELDLSEVLDQAEEEIKESAFWYKERF